MRWAAQTLDIKAGDKAQIEREVGIEVLRQCAAIMVMEGVNEKEIDAIKAVAKGFGEQLEQLNCADFAKQSDALLIAIFRQVNALGAGRARADDP